MPSMPCPLRAVSAPKGSRTPCAGETDCFAADPGQAPPQRILDNSRLQPTSRRRSSPRKCSIVGLANYTAVSNACPRVPGWPRRLLVWENSQVSPSVAPTLQGTGVVPVFVKGVTPAPLELENDNVVFWNTDR